MKNRRIFLDSRDQVVCGVAATDELKTSLSFSNESFTNINFGFLEDVK